MEKINKKELLAKITAGEEDLPKDIDSTKINPICMQNCLKSFTDLYKCMKMCKID